MSACHQAASVTRNFPLCSSRTNYTYNSPACHCQGEKLSSGDRERAVERDRHTQIERGRGGGVVRGCWSLSLFFCDALPSDHLHQVDIRRVYSGVCNCILSPVLHCQPWKWNLINPDQFLMYKMNWQGFKKGGATIQIRWMIHSNFFFSEWLSNPPPPPLRHHHHCNLTTPYHPPLSTIILHRISFSFKARASIGLGSSR